MARDPYNESTPRFVARYHRNRERVLGRRFSLNWDPELAAEELAEQTGGREAARRWAAEVLRALERRAA